MASPADTASGLAFHSLTEGLRQTFVRPKTFADPALEAAFLRHYSRRFASSRRISGLLGMLTWTAYFMLDLLLIGADPVFGASGDALLVLRGLGLPLQVLAVYLSLTRRWELDEAWVGKVMLSGCVAVFVFEALMIYLAPYPYHLLYYFPGLILALVFCFGMFRLRAKALAQLMVIAMVLCLSSIWGRAFFAPDLHLSPMRLAYPWLCTFLMCTVAMVGYGISVQLEQGERASFAAQTSLEASHAAMHQRKVEVERLNLALATAGREAALRAAALVQAKEDLRAQAEQRSKDKSRFLAQAVHDLKQPLQAIGNSLHPALLAQERQEPHKALALIRLAELAANTMRVQLGAILDLSRLESGLVKAELRTFDLAELLREVQAQQSGVGKAQAVELLIQPSLSATYVHSDRHMLERILQNLIGNGIKYRDTGKAVGAQVSLGIDRVDGQACLYVSDNGIGIARDLVSNGHIFEPFFQVGNHLPEHEKGVGLGLSTVRAMLALLPEHHIRVESELGLGSCFSLKLPLQADDGIQRVAAALRQEAAPDMQALASLYVLLVEDDSLVLQSTAALFDAVGIRHEAYASYRSMALAMPAIERTPDVLLSDFRLPEGKTAIDVIATARQYFIDIGVVVFSGEPGDLSEHLSGQDAVFLRKPMAPLSLLRELARFAAPQAG